MTQWPGGQLWLTQYMIRRCRRSLAALNTADAVWRLYA